MKGWGEGGKAEEAAGKGRTEVKARELGVRKVGGKVEKVTKVKMRRQRRRAGARGGGGGARDEGSIGQRQFTSPCGS